MKDSTKNSCCSNCIFFEPSMSTMGKFGECKKKPHRLTRGWPSGEMEGRFRKVSADGICNEYLVANPKEQPAEQQASQPDRD